MIRSQQWINCCERHETFAKGLASLSEFNQSTFISLNTLYCIVCTIVFNPNWCIVTALEARIVYHVNIFTRFLNQLISSGAQHGWRWMDGCIFSWRNGFYGNSWQHFLWIIKSNGKNSFFNTKHQTFTTPVRAEAIVSSAWLGMTRGKDESMFLIIWVKWPFRLPVGSKLF